MSSHSVKFHSEIWSVVLSNPDDIQTDTGDWKHNLLKHNLPQTVSCWWTRPAAMMNTLMRNCPIISPRSTTTEPQRSVSTPRASTQTNCATAVRAVSSWELGWPQCSAATTTTGCWPSIEWCQMTDASVWLTREHPTCRRSTVTPT